MMETQLLNINDSKTLKDLFLMDNDTGNTILLLGSSKAGKTTFLIYLYDNLFSDKNQDSCKGGYLPILFSQNKHAQIYKDPKMKNIIKCDKFTKASETLIYKCQKINQEIDKAPPPSNNPINFLVMLDDVINIKRGSIVSNLILTLRNSNISSIISLQYPKLFGPDCRGNVNNILFFSFNIYSTIETVIKEFLVHEFKNMGIDKMADMVRKYKELTDDYHFLYFNPKKNIFKRYKLNIK